jgi:hypothetical protein
MTTIIKLTNEEQAVLKAAKAMEILVEVFPDLPEALANKLPDGPAIFMDAAKELRDRLPVAEDLSDDEQNDVCEYMYNVAADFNTREVYELLTDGWTNYDWHSALAELQSDDEEEAN